MVGQRGKGKVSLCVRQDVYMLGGSDGRQATYKPRPLISARWGVSVNGQSEATGHHGGSQRGRRKVKGCGVEKGLMTPLAGTRPVN